MSQTEYKDLPENRRHRYRRLDGGLTVALYAGVTIVVLSLVFAAWFGYFASVVGTVHGANDRIPQILLAVIFVVFAAYAGIWTANISSKNVKFLRNFELSAIIAVPFALLTFVLINVLYTGNLVPHLIGLLCGIVVICAYFIIGTTYFRKSVRVRTYFNSGEYMKKSVFFKKLPAPLPAAKDLEPEVKLERAFVSSDYKPVTIMNSEKPKVCPACGGQNYADDKYCSCGEPLEVPDPPTAPAT
ncbi:MAG: hypothetical protein LBN00_05310 [Oscillospiraceae bacterium]|jgi:hypothetical protein|nr:hypothetical protein [Oscillospiraceae bacterium]